jgi:hypothetical protein
MESVCCYVTIRCVVIMFTTNNVIELIVLNREINSLIATIKDEIVRDKECVEQTREKNYLLEYCKTHTQPHVKTRRLG